MQIKHLDHLNLDVRDLDASTAWYGRVFGFEEVERGIYLGHPWKILRAGDAMLAIYERPEALPPPADWDQRPHLGINHFALRILDEAAWRDTLAREQIPLVHGEEIQWPHSTSWYIKDPDGYDIEVVLWKQDVVRFAA